MNFATKLLTGAIGVAAFAATAPVSAQYYSGPYQASPYQAYPPQAQPYGYNQGYSQGYGYQSNGYRGYAAANTNVAAQQCSAAVQQRLYNRRSVGSILGAVLGANTSGRVLGVTQVNPRANGLIRVRGLASSGRMAANGYGPYGVGAYGALGYNSAAAADLSFRCDVLPNGAVASVDIMRR